MILKSPPASHAGAVSLLCFCCYTGALWQQVAVEVAANFLESVMNNHELY